MVKNTVTSDKWLVPSGKIRVLVLLSLVTLHSSLLFCQQPQAQSGQPLYSVNAKYVQGLGPGYWPTPGSGLTLNLAPGTAVCSNVVQTYAGGTLTLAASATNYVYLDPADSCAPAANTTGFTTAAIPIAKVVTTSSAISSLADVRTMFTSNGVTNPGTVSDVGMTGDGIIFSSTVTGSPVTSSGTLAPQLLNQSANTVLAGPTAGSAAAPSFRALTAADLPSTVTAPAWTSLTAPAQFPSGTMSLNTGGNATSFYGNAGISRPFNGVDVVPWTGNLPGPESLFSFNGTLAGGGLMPPTLTGVTSAGAGSLSPGSHTWCITAASEFGANSLAYAGATASDGPYFGETVCSNTVSATVTSSSVNGKQTISFTPPISAAAGDTGYIVYRKDGTGPWQALNNSGSPLQPCGDTEPCPAAITMNSFTDDGTATPVTADPPAVDASDTFFCTSWYNLWEPGQCEMNASYIALFGQTEVNGKTWMENGLTVGAQGTNITSVNADADHPLILVGPSGNAKFDVTNAANSNVYVPAGNSVAVVPNACTSGQFASAVSSTGTVTCSNITQLNGATVPSNASLLGSNGAGQLVSTNTPLAKNLGGSGNTSGSSLLTLDVTECDSIHAFCASGSAATTTTSGATAAAATTVNLASASSFSAGQGIYIAGGGSVSVLATAPTYNSGITATGTGLCLGTPTNGGGANALITFSVSSGTVSGTSNIVSPGQGYTSVPTSWTVTNLTATTCSGTATTAGGALGAANYIGTVQSVASTSVTVSPAITTAVANGATVMHDDTAAINAAVTAAATLKAARILFPTGTYNANGPWQDTGGANAIIPIPHVAYSQSNTQMVTIEFVGATVPPLAYPYSGNVTAGVSSIQTSANAGNLIGAYCATGTCGLDYFTNVWFVLSEMNIVAPANPAITAVNGANIGRLQVKRSNVITSDRTVTNQPIYPNGIGIVSGVNQNAAIQQIKDTSVSGYFIGVDVAEHIQLDGLESYFNYRCVQLENSTHTLWAGYMNLEECPYSIYNNANTGPVNIDFAMVDTENVSSGWYAKVYNIYDPSNYLYGSIHNLGGTGGTYNYSGASNLLLNVATWPTLYVPGSVVFNGANSKAFTVGPAAEFKATSTFDSSTVFKSGASAYGSDGVSYSTLSHLNEASSASYPLATITPQVASNPTWAGLLVASGNATSTQIPAKMVLSTNSNPRQSAAVVGVTYVSTSGFSLLDALSDNTVRTVPICFGNICGASPDLEIDTSGRVGLGTLAVSTSTNACFNTSVITGMSALSTCSSLRMYKSDIAPFDFFGKPALTEVALLNPISYTSKTGGRREAGFVAEEIEKIDSRFSTYDKDGKLSGIDYGHMVALLTKALQEQQAEIVRLRQQVDKLTKGK